jgi:hypothetical protein
MHAVIRATLAFVFWLVVGAAFADEGRALFNGKDLSGWVVEGPSQYKDLSGQVQPMWTVADGVLNCAGKAFGFLRYDRQRFSDFILHVEYQMSAKGNSGIGIRTIPYDPKRSRATRPSFAAYEVQLLDDAGKEPNKHSSGSLYRYVAPVVNPVKPALEWNKVDIECVGPHIRVVINGQPALDVDQSTIPSLKDKPLEGYIALQSHTNKVAFRNIRIQEKKVP